MSLFDFFEGVGMYLDTQRTVADTRRFIREQEREMERWERSSKNRTSTCSTTSNRTRQEFDLENAREELRTFSEKYVNQAKELENKCVEIVNNYCEDLVKSLQMSSAYRKNKFRVPNITKTKVQYRVADKVQYPLKERLSLNDSECSNILKKSSKSERSKAMDTFAKKIKKECLNDIAKTGNEFVNEQFGAVKDDLDILLKKQLKEVVDTRNVCIKNTLLQAVEEKKYAQDCMDAIMTIHKSEAVLELLE